MWAISWHLVSFSEVLFFSFSLNIHSILLFWAIEFLRRSYLNRTVYYLNVCLVSVLTCREKTPLSIFLLCFAPFSLDPTPHHFTLKFHGWWRVRWHLSPKLPWVSSQLRSPPLQTKLLETHAKLSSPQSYSENVNSLENGRMAKNFSLLSNLKSREKHWFFCDDRSEKAVRNSVLA